MKTPMWLVALALMTVALPLFAHAKPVTTEDLVKAQENAGEWLTYGRDYRNWRYSPLAEITPDNAAKLAPVWTMSTGGQFGGLESTPLFRDGVLYFTEQGRVLDAPQSRDTGSPPSESDSRAIVQEGAGDREEVPEV